jgi:hypothetical protein
VVLFGGAWEIAGFLHRSLAACRMRLVTWRCQPDPSIAGGAEHSSMVNAGSDTAQMWYSRIITLGAHKKDLSVVSKDGKPVTCVSLEPCDLFDPANWKIQLAQTRRSFITLRLLGYVLGSVQKWSSPGCPTVSVDCACYYVDEQTKLHRSSEHHIIPTQRL